MNEVERTGVLHRRRGAPRGNQNARKHGFYSKVLDEAEKADFEMATTVEGLDEEIALMRVKIKSVVSHDPENVRLLMEATGMLARLLMTRNHISKEDKNGLREAIANVLRDIAIPVGIGISALRK